MPVQQKSMKPGHAPGLLAVRIGALVAAVALLAIAVATLTPVQPAPPAPRIWGIFGAELGLQDFIDNVAMFIPLGAGLGLATGRARRAMLATLVVSAAIEATQGLFISGRDASFGDVLANVSGGAIGGWLGSNARMLVCPSRAEARRLAAVASVAAATILGVTAWLIAPGAPSAHYEGQFSQYWFPRHGVPLGVLDATINGLPFQWDLIADAGAVNEGVRAEHLRVEGRVVPGAPLHEWSRLIRVIDHDDIDHAPLVALYAEGRDLLFSARTRADAWHVRSPWVLVRNVFPARGPYVHLALPDDWAARLVAGRDTLRIGGERNGMHFHVWAAGKGGEAERTVRVTPADGWMLLVPVSLTPRSGEGNLRAIWLLLVLGPATYWVVWAALPGRRTARTLAG